MLDFRRAYCFHRGLDMDNIRLATEDRIFPRIPCHLCGDNQGHWDTIGGRPYCPNCLEALAMGEAEAHVARTERSRCAICHHQGTLAFHTFPLNWHRPVEIDLCGEHLRGLIARRLGPHAFEQLRRQLVGLGLRVTQVFLLHEAFYDGSGRALQPAVDY
jgi:hypothetical protein